MIKTSKLRLRPFMPLAEVEGSELAPIGEREEFATLSYGGVTIELDYTILRHLELDIKSGWFSKAVQVFNLGKGEILKEMEFNSDKKEKCPEEVWFRDNPIKCSITHPWSPLEREEDNHKSKLDGSRTMVWEKLDDAKG